MRVEHSWRGTLMAVGTGMVGIAAVVYSGVVASLYLAALPLLGGCAGHPHTGQGAGSAQDQDDREDDHEDRLCLEEPVEPEPGREEQADHDHGVHAVAE